MGVFTFKMSDNYKLTDLQEKEYEFICCEFDKIVNAYSLKIELYSKKIWEHITKKYKIDDESDVLTFTEVDVDDKNKIHKSYKYIIKCHFKETFFYLVFNDEDRGWEDDDYHGYVTEDDKSNKIYNLVIYYDVDKISTKDLESDVVKDLMKCLYLPSTKNQFFTISTNQFGYTLKPSYIKDVEIDILLNYGKKFVKIHKSILEKLKTENHGLFLLHGETGTGKTTYIRKLINLLSEKKTIIYVPSYMMSNMADPEFISFLGDTKNVILLLEDAENILTTSVNDRSQAVSNILNMTDGLLNDYMDVQIIATFNTNAKLIDDALKRAGRLQVNYKFGKLSKIDSNKLAKEIGVGVFTKPSTLSEIYEGSNQIINDDLDSTIGFKINK